jgi:hypothetical protein
VRFKAGRVGGLSGIALLQNRKSFAALNQPVYISYIFTI